MKRQTRKRCDRFSCFFLVALLSAGLLPGTAQAQLAEPGAESWSMAAQVRSGDLEPEPERLSLDEAIARSLTGNPDLQIDRSDARSAEWELRSSRADLLPSLRTGFGVSWEGSGSQRLGSLTGDDLGVGGQPSFLFSSYDAGFTWNLSGPSLLGVREREASLEASRAGVSSSETELEREVTLRYLEARRRVRAINLARDELTQAESNLALATARVEVGAATSLDERQARVGVGQARVNLLQEEGEARSARIRLRELMGDPPVDAPLELTTEFQPTPPRWTQEELVGLALRHSPRVDWFRARREVADRRVRSARSAYLPSITVQGGWSGFTRAARSETALLDQARSRFEQQMDQCRMENEIFSRLADPLPLRDCSPLEWSSSHRDAVISGNRAFPFDFTNQPPQLSLSVSIPIFQGLDRRRGLELARVERQNNEHQLRREELDLRSRIGQGLIRAEVAWEALELEAENQELAEDQLQLAREQYELGMVDFLQLLDAQSIRARADRDYLAAVFTYKEALTNLEGIVGLRLLNR